VSSRKPPLTPAKPAAAETEEEAGALEASAQRISEMVSAMASVGADQGGGTVRLAYTPTERNAHRLAAGWLGELGLAVREDSAGNTIADDPRPAGSPAPIAIGSHLDGVPHGGNFDGVAGIVAAVEVVRSARERGIARPLRVVCFAAEEGARFGEPCIGSKAVAGLLGRSATTELADETGTTLGAAMRGVGLDPARLPDARWAGGDVAAFLELHVEQGRILEDQGVSVGLVEAVAGSLRLVMTVHGRADHPGGAQMRDRGDALAAAAEIALAVEAAGRDPSRHGLLATVGRMVVEPNSPTTIPGLVRLWADVRDVDTERLRTIASSLARTAAEICDHRGVRLETRAMPSVAPVILPTWVRQVATDACRQLGHEYRVVTSCGSRDAQVMNHLVPAGLVLVPSRHGASHVPDEWTSSVDIARGAGLMVEWIARLDQSMAQWERAKN
jgi:allantoate deiminase